METGLCSRETRNCCISGEVSSGPGKRHAGRRLLRLVSLLILQQRFAELQLPHRDLTEWRFLVQVDSQFLGRVSYPC